MRRPIIIAFAAMSALRIGHPGLAAVELPSGLSEYVLASWQSDDGLPQNSVISMAQTSDGYLWLSTFGGLARFNGKRFDVFGDNEIPELSGEYFTTLRADATGNLWLRGEHNRAVLCRNGRFRLLDAGDGLPPGGACALEVGPHGTVWIGDEKGRLLRYERGHFVVAGNAPPSADWGPLYNLRIDKAGVVWTWSDRGCSWWANGIWTSITTPKEGSPIRTLQPSRDGGVLFARDDRLYHYGGGQVSELDRIPGGFYGYFIAEDPNGDLWISSRDGVLRRDQTGTWSEFAGAEAFLGAKVRSELLDREGNRWFGTDGGGLVRLTHRAVHAVGVAEGLSKRIVLSVSADGANSVWAAALNGGLNHFDGARFSPVLVPPHLGAESLAWCVRPARGGGVWVGTYDHGLYWLGADRKDLRRFEPEAQPGLISGMISALYEAPNNDLWIGGERGLSRFSQGKFRMWSTRDGLAANQVNAIAQDRSGAMWVGTLSGLNRIAGDQVSTLKAPGGFAGNSVRALFCDSQGDLWVGGYDLVRYQNGRFALIAEGDLPARPIKGILEDDQGYLWFATAHGLLRASRRQLAEFCDTGKGHAAFSLFSKADGLPSNECSGSQPAAWKGPDGRLWFATLAGVGVIDPKRLPHNQLPPPVVIEAVVADEKPVPLPEEAPAGARLPNSRVVIPAGNLRLQLQFAALSYTAPDKNRYRYRLEGFDSKWENAGSSQVAGYTHLPPGAYHFQVIACNNDGVWNETGASLALEVLPFFWQTGWFHTLVAVAAAGLIYWLFRLRLAQVERRRLAQESFARQLIETQEAERKRIARELHDGVGQTLLLAKNRLAIGIGKAEPKSHLLEDLGQASSEVSQAIDEIRATARALRPVELDRLGLAKALESMLDRIGRNTTTRFSHELDQLPEVKNKETEIQLYRIAQEAINNVVKHSKAREVIVELKLEGPELRLTVQDDGAGFDPAASSHPGGFGLSGMAERSRLIGGTLTVKSAPAKGCRLTVTVPLPKPGHD